MSPGREGCRGWVSTEADARICGARQLVGEPFVVVVEKCDELAPGGADAGIPGRAASAALPVHHPDPIALHVTHSLIRRLGEAVHILMRSTSSSEISSWVRS